MSPKLACFGALALGMMSAISVLGCAREQGERPPPQSYVPPPPPLATAPPLATERPRPEPVLTAPQPSATATATAPPVTSSAAPVAMTPKELFRAQDACLDHCDQFACMKVANAYRQGAGVPIDVLAGRRYAIHACLECGAPGLAIVDQCPNWGVSETTPKKK